MVDSADFFIARQNWEKAEIKIIEALRLEPANFGNSLLFSNLGLIQAEKGDFNKALESLSLGLNIAPSSTVLLNNRAHVYLMIDSIDSAIKDIDRSLAIDSLQEWTLQTRAFLCLQENNTNKAFILFDKLQKEFPGNNSVYSGLAAVEEKEGNYVKAADFYKRAIANKPEDEETREAYISLLIKIEDYSLARSQIREALEINPENPMFYLLRGYLHRLNYRPDEALADKKIAISKGADPQYVSTFIP